MLENETPAGEPVQQSGSDKAREVSDLDGRVEHPQSHFEPKDIDLRPIIVSLVAALGIIAGIYYGVWRFYWFQAQAREEVKRSRYPMASGPSTNLPPQPRLEQLDRMPAKERDLFRGGAATADLAADEKALHRYGPTSETGFVQIPIEQAIKAIAGTLPVANETSPGVHANGLLDAGQSNSGRMFRGWPPARPQIPLASRGESP